jgi:hypothetical protein
MSAATTVIQILLVFACFSLIDNAFFITISSALFLSVRGLLTALLLTTGNVLFALDREFLEWFEWNKSSFP